jgi:hypothetical protein
MDFRLIERFCARRVAGSLLALFLMTPEGIPQLLRPNEPNPVIEWDRAALESMQVSHVGAPIAARLLAIVHTCMYDAWAAYDQRAVGTQLRGVLRRPVPETTDMNKRRAISFAAYRALVDLLPAGELSIYGPLMRKQGYDPGDVSTDIWTATGIGNVACAAVLEYRHHDKSNQLGDIVQGSFEDWTNYVPANVPGTVPSRLNATNPNRWQPLAYVDSTGNFVLQKFAGAQWCFVTPFAMSKGEDFRSVVEPGPFRFGSPEYQQQAEDLIAISASLTNRQKMIAEYWSDGPYSEQPPRHWMRFAQFVSERDHHTLDDDVKMFFALANAMLDSSIAAWDAKRTYDSVRPVTAISFLFKGKKIRSWGGPGKGTVEMDGSQWIPYQLATFPTPPFPEYVSGHSTYSAVAARILALWTGSDHFGDSVTLETGSSKIEPGITPANPVILKWETFSDAANEAGMSRRYGGIHFARADMVGRTLGRLVADRAWVKAQSYFDGTNSSPAPTYDSFSANSQSLSLNSSL